MEAWVYVEFSDPVRQNLVERALERLGATQFRVDSFSYDDYAEAATKGLKTVEDKARCPGFKLIERGSPSPYVRRSVGTESTVPMAVTKDMQRSLEESDEKVLALEEEVNSRVSGLFEFCTASLMV